MSVLIVERPWAATPPARTRFVDRLRFSLLWLAGVSGGFVMFEPAPYEFVMLIAMIVFLARGLPIRPGHLPLLGMLLMLTLGFLIGLTPVITETEAVIWTVVSCYLAVTTLFFALAMTEDSARRLDALLKGYVLSAVLVSLIGILAYFNLLPSADAFLRYSRVKSTFKDPNVFGPFLVLPGLILIERLMFGTGRARLVAASGLIVIAGGLFLSFSRGAWGHFAASAAIFFALTYVTRRSGADRARIVAFAVIACIALVLLVLALLSLPQVAALFEERSRLMQSYDAESTGRFGRHVLGALLMLDNPFGIGPMQFTTYFTEDPHNSVLAALAAGGWIGGFAYLALVISTIVAGFRHAFVASPLQQRYIAIYATFLGAVGESYIIDVLHWRHFFMLIGVLWGLMIASRMQERGDAAQQIVALNRPVLVGITR